MTDLGIGYPKGWFRVAATDEVRTSEVRPIRAFGEDLVLWRTVDGTPVLMIAHCPHMGAHLGFGGSVADRALKCPFHGWEFNTDGTCKKVPYSRATPLRARLLTYPIVESMGYILAWSRPETPPTWTPIPPGDEAVSALADRYQHVWRIASSVEEMGENVADLAHFRHLHNFQTREWSEEVNGARRIAKGVVEGIPGGQPWRVQVIYDGPGIGYAWYRGDTNVFQLSTLMPIEARLVELRFDFYVPSRALDREGHIAGRFYVRHMIKTIDDDIVIWEHRRTPSRPCFVPEDNAIAEFRRWIHGLSV